MFALEITFNEVGVPPETVLIRRPSALVGGQDYAHVVLDDMAPLDYQLRVVRGLGRTFKCYPVGSGAEAVSEKYTGNFNASTSLDLGVVILHFIALDSDLCLKDNEAPDKVGVRVLRRAAKQLSPKFPAVVVQGEQPVAVSFHSDSVVSIGRASDCLLRFDSSDISSHHARLGIEGNAFWIEDLGSTNGTFINEQQVVGRQTVPSGGLIVLGREIGVTPIVSEDQLEEALLADEQPAALETVREAARYPVLVSLSEVVRPTRVVLTPGTLIHVGREPTNDMWLGAPHISRRHATVLLTETGAVQVADNSTNGIGFEGRIIGKGQLQEIRGHPAVLDFGGAVTLGLCFDEAQERRFLEAGGGLSAFSQDSEEQHSSNTSLKMRLDQGMQLRQTTSRGFSTGKTYGSVQRRRPLIRGLILIVLVAVGFIGMIVFELVRGGWKLGMVD